MLAATGEIVWVKVRATIIRDAEGKGVYNLGMIENITDRKISEAALQQSEAQLRKQAAQLQRAYEKVPQTQAKLVHTEKMSSLGQMIAGIAHKINNPITFIEGNITYASDYFKEYGQLPMVECCAGQLNQVFMNIISNAIDALIDQPEPGTITIRTSLGAKEWRLNQDEDNYHLASLSSSIPDSGVSRQNLQFMTICIADNGPGMTEETCRRLFDPFFTTKPVGSGTGLGLSISYQIVVEKH